METKMSFKQLLDECPPGIECEVYSVVPNPGPDDPFTWRVRIPGRGVFMGRADKHRDEHGEEFLAMAGPAAFHPRKLADPGSTSSHKERVEWLVKNRKFHLRPIV